MKQNEIVELLEAIDSYSQNGLEQLATRRNILELLDRRFIQDDKEKVFVVTSLGWEFVENYKDKQRALEAADEANRLAKEANRFADKANHIAKQANAIAVLALATSAAVAFYNVWMAMQ